VLQFFAFRFGGGFLFQGNLKSYLESAVPKDLILRGIGFSLWGFGLEHPQAEAYAT
jgi:hypothetical protein